jgi:hypothetical protein
VHRHGERAGLRGDEHLHLLNQLIS